jgi:hypothetical protein
VADRETQSSEQELRDWVDKAIKKENRSYHRALWTLGTTALLVLITALYLMKTFLSPHTISLVGDFICGILLAAVAATLALFWSISRSERLKSIEKRLTALEKRRP